MILTKIHQFSMQLKKSNYLFSVVGVLSIKFSQVLIQILLARYLIPADYSKFYFYYAVVTGLSTFVGEALGQTSTRLIKKAEQFNANLVSTALFGSLVASIIPALLVLMHSLIISKDTMPPNFIIVIMLFASIRSAISSVQYIAISLGLHR